ncbi:MAG: Glu-tRNA(Gln) amidotransferase subunit GatD [Deltaproteobacteria bacterium]|nr:Glu-tRNA(Gln) amidotransferase subunit GatD [Deltaproteobacteria bacterium]
MAKKKDEDELKGYKGAGRKKLAELGLKVWDDIVLETSRGSFAGIILPRSENADDLHLVLKLHNGYNVGVRVDAIDRAQVQAHKRADYHIPEGTFPVDPAKPDVVLLGTGGTIASRLDYRTGAVIPAFSPGELYGAVPDLADVCNLETKKLFGIFSENMGREQWLSLARETARAIEAGADGVVIGHGTDTMHHTAAVMTFMLQNLPVPVVLVGSQRSSDRPSSDAARNLIHACWTAGHGPIAEVMVCMFGPTSDSYGLLHRGTRVRKMHSSYRSTFRTLGDTPLAMVDSEGIQLIRQDVRRRDPGRKLELHDAFDDRVSIVYYYPNMRGDIIDSLVEHGYRGIVIAGTGLGHVNQPLYDPLRRAVAAGLAVYMTVQTLWGFVQMFVYDTGRDLLDIGVIPLGNMLPEVAYMKLGWALGRSQDLEEVRRIMLTPVSDETTEREPPNGYIVLQGGIPEVDEFMGRHYK